MFVSVVGDVVVSVNHCPLPIPLTKFRISTRYEVILLPWSYGACQFKVAVPSVELNVGATNGSGAPNVCPCATGPSAPNPKALIPVTLK